LWSPDIPVRYHIFSTSQSLSLFLSTINVIRGEARMKRINIDVQKCSGCRYCEMVCSFHHERRFSTNLSRIRVAKEDKYGFDFPILCHQCDTCPSVNACPTRAMTRTESGIIQVREDLCTGCGACANSCTFKALKLDDSSQPLVCDLCSGEPACVKRCPTGALSFKDSETFFDQPEDALRRFLSRWMIVD